MESKVTEESAILDHQYIRDQSLQSEVQIFEDYLFYAAIQRQEEENTRKPIDTNTTLWISRLVQTTEKTEVPAQLPLMTPEQKERANASRVLRLTSWISVFYLITTDVMGPFFAPFSISQVGWVPGIVLYVFMGISATYSGLILWLLFLKLDSPRHPLRTYSDIVQRIYGRVAGHVCSTLQSLQLILGVGAFSLGGGQGLSQMTQGRLCFSVCVLIYPIVGITIGQIRSLKNFGWFANSAVFMTVALVLISMGFVAHSPPNYAAAQLLLGVDPGPVVTETFVDLPFYAKINGVMQMVAAYGGAMIFPEMLAEMKRPMDFWKAFSLAQLLILTVYLLYGTFIYAFQGQFTLPLAFQGVSRYSWQTVGNVLGFVTGIIAAGLYANIGAKIIYNQIFEEWFKGPSLMSSNGRYTWSALIFIYWSLAFLLGSAIPQLANIVSLISAIAIMQFTYTFPPLIFLGYQVFVDAMSHDMTYVPGHGMAGRVDTWGNWSRWKRGIFGGRWYFKLFNLAFGLGGLATACLGVWASTESIKVVFQRSGAATSFGCTAPM